MAGAAPAPPRGQAAGNPTPVATPQVNPLLERIAERHQATLGVYVHHLGTGELLQMNADRVFRSASLYKLFVLHEAFSRLATNSLAGSETLTMSEQALINEPYA